MGPDERDLEEGIRGHLALSVHERLERGDDPAVARRGAVEELGGLLRTRGSMREVWRSRPLEWMGELGQDVRIAWLRLASGGPRVTPGTNRRLQAFAIAEIALSFVLLSGAAMLLAALVLLQRAETGYEMRRGLRLRAVDCLHPWPGTVAGRIMDST